MVAATVRVVALLVPKMLVQKLLQLRGDGVFLLDGIKYLSAGELLPIRRHDDGVGIFPAQERLCLSDFFLRHAAGTGQDDAACRLNLIVKKLSEIFHIQLRAGGVDDGGQAAEDEILVHGLDGRDDLGELPHAGRLDNNAVGAVLCQHHMQRAAEIAGQTAADTAGVHLVDGHAGILQKAAVDADLAELVFDEHKLFAGIPLRDEFFDECRLPRSEEPGDDIDFCHGLCVTFLA